MTRNDPRGLRRGLVILAACGACTDPSYAPKPIESLSGIDLDDAVGDGTSSDPSDTTETGAQQSTAIDSLGAADDASTSTTSSDATTSGEGDDTSGGAASTSASGTSTTASSTAGGDESGDETGNADVPTFPDPAAFGDDVQELDLVGRWGLNWDPTDGFDSVLEIDATGEFLWAETSADCSTTTVASGVAWVEAMQIVLHVETWEGPLPWDTEPVLGETFAPPFRMRMSFSLQGGGTDAYLALAAPSRVTQGAPYTGESYIRIAQQGAHLGGTWHGEAELVAIREGESEPTVIVRDYYDAFLEPESNPTDPQGTGTRAVTTQYFPVPQSDSIYDGANWTCLGGCPQPAGTTLVDGSSLYTYGPYAGQTHLMPLADDRTFRRDVGSDCPSP